MRAREHLCNRFSPASVAMTAAPSVSQPPVPCSACASVLPQQQQRQQEERIVNFVFLTHDLLNRPFVLIPVSLSHSLTPSTTTSEITSLAESPAATPATATSSSTDLLSALSSLSTQLNLLLPTARVSAVNLSPAAALAASSLDLAHLMTQVDAGGAAAEQDVSNANNGSRQRDSGTFSCTPEDLPTPAAATADADAIEGRRCCGNNNSNNNGDEDARH